MSSNLLSVSSSPHVRSVETTERLMTDVLIALVPALAGAWVFFGRPALVVVAVSVASALVTEAAMVRVRGRTINGADVTSAAVTGLLLAFCVTPLLRWWMAAIGSAFAIAIAKHCFGGLGYNVFNPALAGRLFLMAAYPREMTSWISPDAVSQATPLGILKEATGDALPSTWNLFVGNVGGSIGETSALLLLVGAGYLLARRVITLPIPIGFLGSLALFVWVFGGKTTGDGAEQMKLLTGDPLFHILAGGAMLGAWYMATDYVTSPMTAKGQWVFGIGCGIFTGIIRIWGGYPEGVAYSIILMNIATPLIDQFTKPRLFGESLRK